MSLNQTSMSAFEQARTVITDLEPNHCPCCGSPGLRFYFRTDCSAEGPPVGDEGEAVKALTRAARRYYAALRLRAGHEVIQPALHFAGYEEEEPDGQCPEHTNWRVTFGVDYQRDKGTPRRGIRKSLHALESAAHAFALAATPATQIGGAGHAE
jgi:hypothetical protein